MSENLQENKELKPKSFRITDETHKKFKEISEEIGGNQQVALDSLIHMYELEKSKTVLTGKAETIEEFQKSANKLVSLYTASLEYQQKQAELIRVDFQRELNSKDKLIMELQDQNRELQISEETANETMRELELENKKLKKQLEESKSQYKTDITNMERILAEKENLNRSLTDSCNSLKEKVEQLKLMKEQLAEMTGLKNQLVQLQAELDKKELEHERALFAIERKHNAELMEQNKKHLEDIRQYQTMFFNSEQDKE